MSIILRDATNPSNLAAIDSDGAVHVVGVVSITGGTPSPVDTSLGIAATFGGVGGGGITNTGNTVVTGGSIGTYPTASITGFPPGVAVIDAVNGAAAQAAALAAYNQYSALAFTVISASTADLTALGNGATTATWLPGNYSAGTSMSIPTSITLDAQGNPDAIFVFKAGSTINLSGGASVLLVNGAQANNVVWIVGSSFTSVATSMMTGDILANNNITLGGGTLNGRALAGIVTTSGALTISAATNINVPSSLVTPTPVDILNFPVLQQVALPIALVGNSPAATVVTSTSASILAANLSRKVCRIENTNTVTVFLGFGQTPTATAYHVALKGCTGANDGTGGVYESTVWKGAINAIVASTSGDVVVTELT
jgi:hypothetical protein